jgi:pyruvate/2-oxoglutarate dehydrogenase complex dihydrolipoamide acyltransferase (E2) component
MAIGGVTGVALLVWLGIGGESAPPAPVSPAPAPAPAATPAPAPARAAAPAPPAAPKRPARVTVVFTGTGDTGSYLEVRGRNAQGATAYSGILAPGTSERFTVRRSLWVRVGNTDGVEVTVDGRARALDGGTADFIVTRSGVRRIDDAG